MTQHKQYLFILLTLIILHALPAQSAPRFEVGGIVLKEGPQDLVDVTREEWSWRSGPKTFPAVSYTMKSGRFIYGLRHDLKYGSGTIGIFAPTRSNWYQSGMLYLYLNGKLFGLLPESNETISLESGRRGFVKLSWENEMAKVNYDFMLSAGDDMLFLEITLDPKTKIEKSEIRLRNYPSGFNRSPEHAIHTPLRRIPEKGPTGLDTQKEYSIFYADKTLDPADGRGDGPCAVAFSNDGLQKATVHAGGYGTTTSLHFNPDTRRMRFCFWEFSCIPNQEALEYWRSAHEKAVETLRQSESLTSEPEQATAIVFPPCCEIPVLTAESPDWNRLPRVKGPFYRAGEKLSPLASQQTEAKLAFDDENLHVLLHCREKNMDKVVGFNVGADIWKDDCVEVFIDANLDRTTYMHFVVSVSGQRYAWNMDKEGFTEGWQAVCSRESGYWTAELTIPFSLLGITPKSGRVIGIGLCRERRAGESEYSTWTPPRGFHKPQEWACAILGTYADMIKSKRSAARESMTALQETLGNMTVLKKTKEKLQRWQGLLSKARALLVHRTITDQQFASWLEQWETLEKEASFREIEYEIKIAELLSTSN